MKRPSLAVQRLAQAEASWFFEVLGGKIPEGADDATQAAFGQVDAWLRELPAFHRGVLRLRYVPRTWPKCIETAFDEMASVVVRLECAQHPAIGTTEALEAAAVTRLTDLIRQSESARQRRRPTRRDVPIAPAEKAVMRLTRRAYQHIDLAERALARVRGTGPSVVPGAAK